MGAIDEDWRSLMKIDGEADFISGGSCKKQERRFGANFKNAKHFEIGSAN